MAWLGENWHYFTGIGGGLLLLAFYLYARRHPDGVAMSLWQRAYYTAVATAVAGGVCFLITAVFFPASISLLLSPVFPCILIAVMWFAAPYLRRWIPPERGQR